MGRKNDGYVGVVEFRNTLCRNGLHLYRLVFTLYKLLLLLNHRNDDDEDDAKDSDDDVAAALYYFYFEVAFVAELKLGGGGPYEFSVGICVDDYYFYTTLRTRHFFCVWAIWVNWVNWRGVSLI